MISVIVPTVDGRSEYLNECRASYAAHTDDYQLIIIENRPACGVAWLEGAELADGDYIHFSADDLQPHAGWWQAAIKIVDLGHLPAPRILDPDGTLQTCGGSDGFEERRTGHRTDFTRIPFMSRVQWEKIKPRVETFLSQAHYYTDNVISWAGAFDGFQTFVSREYLLTHHFAQAKRGAGMSERDRMMHDYNLFVTHTSAGG